MLEFKLQYYFEKYKDSNILSTTKFRYNFIKTEGEFPLINELIVKILRYQYKKYGDLVGSGKSIFRRCKKGELHAYQNRRMYTRFGSKEERNIRKRRYDNER